VVASKPEPEVVARAIEAEFKSWQDSGYDRSQIRKIGRANFSQDVILDRWVELLTEIESKMGKVDK